MHKQVVVGAAATLGFLASPVAAQDMGFRVGVIGGLDSVELGDETGDASESDLMYGATVGYDYSFGSGFFGVEGEYSESEVSVTEIDVLVVGDRVTLSAGRDIYVGVRAGIEAGRSGLRFYGKAGYTSARIHGSYFDGTTTMSESLDADGVRVGAGLEFPIGPAALRAEYRYSDYGEVEYQDVGSGIDAGRNQFIAGIVLGF